MPNTAVIKKRLIDSDLALLFFLHSLDFSLFASQLNKTCANSSLFHRFFLSLLFLSLTLPLLMLRTHTLAQIESRQTQTHTHSRILLPSIGALYCKCLLLTTAVVVHFFVLSSANSIHIHSQPGKRKRKRMKKKV